MERNIIERIFGSRRLQEASFEAGGSKYSAAFGRYSRDGEEISRDDYFAAKEKVVSKVEKETSSSTKDTKSDFDISAMSKTAGSPVKNGKEGPYYYDNGDMVSFEKSVLEMTSAFKAKYDKAETVQTSKSQTVIYDEESGNAIIVKKSPKSGKSWVQYKKLNDYDKSLIAKSESANTEKQDTDTEDEVLVSQYKEGDRDAADKLIKKYEKLAYHLSKDLFLPDGSQEDLVQEALMGLVSAMKDYVPGKNKNFKQFAILAMKRNMQDAIRIANRQSNSFINKAEDYETAAMDRPSGGSKSDPERAYMEKSDKARLVKYMRDNLTDWEQKVLGYYLRGYSYDEIAEKTGKNNKSINNAMNMVRAKLWKYKETYKESVLITRVLESLETDSKEFLEETYNYLYK